MEAQSKIPIKTVTEHKAQALGLGGRLNTQKGATNKRLQNKEQGGANLLHSLQVRGGMGEGTDRGHSAERNQ